MAASDGGMFSFGDAGFSGSAVGQSTSSVVGMAGDAASGGYWMINVAGTAFNFNAPAYG